jgi:hypothetical protein
MMHTFPPWWYWCGVGLIWAALIVAIYAIRDVRPRVGPERLSPWFVLALLWPALPWMLPLILVFLCLGRGVARLADWALLR